MDVCLLEARIDTPNEVENYIAKVELNLATHRSTGNQNLTRQRQGGHPKRN